MAFVRDSSKVNSLFSGRFVVLSDGHVCRTEQLSVRRCNVEVEVSEQEEAKETERERTP